MRYEVFELDIDYKKAGLVHEGANASVTTYLPDVYPDCQRLTKRPLVIVCPGGGYGHHSPREGEAVALKLNSLGFAVIVLRYSLAPSEYPCALYELAYMVRMARENADEWNIYADKIIAAGFSAGGHLAAALGTMWNSQMLRDLGFNSQDIRPDGMLLSYPVITSGEFAHRKSFINLLGKQYEQRINEVSLENQVTCDTVPAFIWHTFSDGSVPVENSLLFAKALREHGVKFELHIFPNGNHGLGLATEQTDTKDGSKLQPECAVWPELFTKWYEGCIR
jgi:acetyl esterase/lipase